MEQIELVLSLATTAIGLLITAVTFFAKFVGCARAQKAADALIMLGNKIVGLVEEAETFVTLSGEEKKKYVMDCAARYAADNGLVFDAAAVSARIEELVELSKRVNGKG